ncbi:nucleotidyltransferase family protein [Pseudoalteromonas sp. T1lg65]|uniref:nucleotidyltransferase family protein n=1 Tax=Pseudoalteromonas sp. T1lg65 TaxID=2077101 RepID=UPI003F7B2292
MFTGTTPRLIILAGGLGSRFGGDKQVALLPGIGKTIMELSILDAYQAGVTEVVLIINATVRSLVEQAILPRLPKAIKVYLVEQSVSLVPEEFAHLTKTRTKPWGTGHALLCAKHYLDQPAIVITADDYYGPRSFTQLVEHFLQYQQMAMVAYPIINTLSSQGGVNRGICNVVDNQLQAVEEFLNISQQQGKVSGQNPLGERVVLDEHALSSMTCWGVNQSLINQLEQGFKEFLLDYDNDVKKEYYLPNCIQACIDSGQQQVRVYQAQDTWFGVTYKNELNTVADNILRARAALS